MRILHILSFLVGVQLMINGVFFSSSLLTAIGAALICLFILLASKRGNYANSAHQQGNLGPRYHQVGNGHQETYFAPIALISLIAGALAYLFLPIADVYGKTALTLMGTGLLYMLLSTFAHGFRLSMKNVLGILFGGLFILGTGATVALWRTPIKGTVSHGWNKVYAGVFKKTIIVNNSSLETPVTESGVVQTGMLETSLAVASGRVISTPPPMNTTNTSTTSSTDTETSSQTPPANANEELTYGKIVMYIANKYNMSASNKPDITFTNFPNYDNRYQAFKAAYYNRFFSKTIDPEKKATCDNYVVFIGLAEKWPLSYTAANVYDVFRAEARRRGITNGCEPGESVTWANLN